MDLEKIAALVRIFEDSELERFEYKDSEVEIELDRRKITADQPVSMPVPVPVPVGMPLGNMSAGNPMPSMPEAKNESSDDEEECFITSPIVGTFYSAAAPDVPAYVCVGDRVKAGQTVCILEAMKLMNEIECEFDCEIEAVLVSNEQKVEYGQPLFRVKKL